MAPRSFSSRSFSSRSFSSRGLTNRGSAGIRTRNFTTRNNLSLGRSFSNNARLQGGNLGRTFNRSFFRGGMNVNRNFAVRNNINVGRNFAGNRGGNFGRFWGPYWGAGYGPYWGRYGFYGGYGLGRWFGLGYLPFYLWSGYGGYGYGGYGGYGYGTNYASTYADPALVEGEAAPSTAGLPTADEYFANAQNAFQQGDYANAVKLASHAAVENPQDSNVHQFIGMALFAMGDYPGAASAYHLTLSMGAPWTWSAVSQLYGRPDDYTTQLRALEKQVAEKADDPATQFVLAYQYVLLGHDDNARRHLARVMELEPKDELAGALLKNLESPADGAAAPLGAPEQPPQPPSGAPGTE